MPVHVSNIQGSNQSGTTAQKIILPYTKTDLQIARNSAANIVSSSLLSSGLSAFQLEVVHLVSFNFVALNGRGAVTVQLSLGSYVQDVTLNNTDNNGERSADFVFRNKIYFEKIGDNATNDVFKAHAVETSHFIKRGAGWVIENVGVPAISPSVELHKEDPTAISTVLINGQFSDPVDVLNGYFAAQFLA